MTPTFIHYCQFRWDRLRHEPMFTVDGACPRHRVWDSLRRCWVAWVPAGTRPLFDKRLGLSPEVHPFTALTFPA